MNMPPRRFRTSACFAMLSLLGCGCATLRSQPPPAAIIVDGSTTYQTITGWEGVAQACQDDCPGWRSFNNGLLDAVAELGINRVRIELKTTANCSAPTWDYSGLDSQIREVVNPLRERLSSRGESLWANLCFVDDAGQCYGSSGGKRPLSEYANRFRLAVEHIQSTYGWTPDSFEIALEPTVVSPHWTPADVGNAITLLESELINRAGIPRPYLIGPSTPSGSGAFILYFDQMPGSSRAKLSELSYHRYFTVVPSDIRTRSQAARVPPAMLEYGNADFNDLHTDLKEVGVVAWEKMGLAYYPENLSYDRYVYFQIDSQTATRFAMMPDAKLLRQYFKYVRGGAVRVEASGNSTLDPVAFRNTNGTYVVVVKASDAASFTVKGLPPGQYGQFYTTSPYGQLITSYDVQPPDQQLAEGGEITASIPERGVLTIYGKAAPAGTVPPGAPVAPNPANAATGLGSSVTLSWTNTGTVASNEVRFGAVNPPPAVATVSGSTYTPPALTLATTYYWQVISKNSSGSAASPVWSFTTAQPVCSYSLSADSVSAPAAASNAAVTVTAPAGCPWNAAANSPWLAVTSASGSGSGPVNFAVSANPGAVRSGSLTVAGKTVAVSQGSAGLRFVPLTPCRVMDTRLGDGPFGGPVLSPGATRDVALPAGACGLPSNAAAYSLNVTAVPVGRLAFLTVWPAGQPRPGVSLLNSFDGRIKANAALVPAGAASGVSLYATEAVHVILDVNGYFVPPPAQGLAFYAVPPCRVADTRLSPDARVPAAGETRLLPVAPACGVPTSARAYSLNLTAVPTEPLAFLTAWPAGEPKPFVSALNAPTGTVTANAAIVPAGAGGSIAVFVTNPTHLVVDVDGYFAPPGAAGELLFYATPSCRLADTRTAPGPYGGPPLASSAPRQIPLSGVCALPTTAKAYALNATILPAEPLGFLTLWPSGQPRPTVSTLNSFDAAVVSNLAIVPAGAGASIAAFATNPADLILDVSGYFSP